MINLPLHPTSFLGCSLLLFSKRKKTCWKYHFFLSVFISFFSNFWYKILDFFFKKLAILVKSTLGNLKIKKIHNSFVEKRTKFILIFIYCNTNLHFFSSTFTLKFIWKCFTNPKPTENNAWSHGIKWFFCDQTNQCGGSPSCQTNETNAERQWDKTHKTSTQNTEKITPKLLWCIE